MSDPKNEHEIEREILSKLTAKIDDLKEEQVFPLARRIYGCLSACASLETVARAALSYRGKDREPQAMALLEEAIAKANEARQAADMAMHNLGIGYYDIYPTKERAHDKSQG